MAPIKILLAEDDLDDQDFFNDFIETRADVALVSIAENGEEVFNALTGITEDALLPDFIILDQNMPKRNGLQTLQMLKKSRAYEAIPVFIYSTYTDDNLRQQSLEAGATSVFSKPDSPEGYNKMINAMIALLK